MLQIHNIGNGKSEWNVSETHLIIPMIDGDLIPSKERDKILTSAITLNTLEGSDQTILTNALEHSLVLGLDKNLFESTNYKSDLLIIQNSDLKLLQCNNDMKVAQTLPDVEQDKSETLWQSPILKEKILGNEKAIFEVRHVLNYDDIDLEKTNRQINLENISSDVTSQVIRAEKEVFTGETTNQEKSNPDSSFTVSFNPETDKNKLICISLNNEVSKTIENIKSVRKKMPLQSEACSDLNNMAPYKFGEDFEEGIFNATNHIVSYSNLSPVTLIDFNKHKPDKNDKTILNTNPIDIDTKTEGDRCNDGTSDSFQEKNLPLKKKAKMKRTLMAINSENQKTLNGDVSAHEQTKMITRRNTKQTAISPQEKQENPDKSNSEPAINGVSKPKNTSIKGLHKSCLVKETKGDLKKADLFEEDELANKKSKLPELLTKFKDISELVEYLLKCRMINTTVWQTLNSGLKEMKVDILKEMITKKKEHCSPESSNYSPQLKAFALVLYFKQPAAFNHLSQMYKNGWPSLKVIKEWKRRMNARRRMNFIRVQSYPEHSKS